MLSNVSEKDVTGLKKVLGNKVGITDVARKDISSLRDQHSRLRHISDRDLVIYLYRERGATYTSLGAVFGISAGRARQIVERIRWKLSRPEGDWPELTPRAFNCLRAAGYTTIKQVRDAILDGSIHSKDNYGNTTHVEVLEWLLRQQ